MRMNYSVTDISRMNEDVVREDSSAATENANPHPAGEGVRADRSGEEGSAIIIAVLILGLMSVFVALALSRTTTEAMVMGNDAANARTHYAAQASLETMTINFKDVFTSQLNPPEAAIKSGVENKKPSATDFPGFDFNRQTVSRLSTDSRTVTIKNGNPFEGLTALQDTWRLKTTVTGPTGAQVSLTRDFLNNRVPVFQFGAFYDGDLELHAGPKLYMRGRVHTNGNFFIKANDGTYFTSRISAVGHIVTDVGRTGADKWQNKVYICPRGKECTSDTDADFVQLTEGQGSVLEGPDFSGIRQPLESKLAAGVTDDPDMPNGTDNGAAWVASRNRFRNGAENGTLENGVKALKLPIKLGNDSLNNIELIKRGLDTDNETLHRSRYFNKPSIRVSLSDTRAQLPGGAGGVRLDENGGYPPSPMKDGYQATRFNAYRMYRGASYAAGSQRETWIKVERVVIDPNTSNAVATDITTDFLSLGITERQNLVQDTSANTVFQITDANYNSGTVGNRRDERSILKLQRFTIQGPPIKTDKDGVVRATELSASPILTRLDSNVDFNWGTGSPTSATAGLPAHLQVKNDNFMVRWTGQIKPNHASGKRTYKFYTNSSDGVRLFIRDASTGVRLATIDKWVDRATPTTDEVSVDLAANTWYDIQMDYYENSGDASARLRWSQRTNAVTPATWSTVVAIPGTQLRPSASSTAQGLRGDYYNSNFRLPAYGYTNAGEGYSFVTGESYLLPGEAMHAVDATVSSTLHKRFNEEVVAGATPVTVSHNVNGSNDNQFRYVNANGTVGIGTNWGQVTTDSYSETQDAYFQVKFNGTQIHLYGAKAPGHGIAAVSIDGGPEELVDFYRWEREEGNALLASPVYTSPTMPQGAHTMRVRVTRTKNSSSTGYFVTPQRIVIFSTSATAPPATVTTKVVPFPIEMFDTREGLYDESLNTADSYGPSAAQPEGRVTMMGKMSVIDIDVNNLRRFLSGEFDGQFVNNLSSSNYDTNANGIAQDNGWIVYVSDRRGDADNDGEFDMENVYVDSANPNAAATKETGEDVNGDGTLQADYQWEGARYREGAAASPVGSVWGCATHPLNLVNPSTSEYYATAYTDIAALFDHKHFRRTVRAINGRQPPGTPTQGLTISSENGLYIQGNYNATSVSVQGSPTEVNQYLPQGTVSAASTQVPASFAADAVTILSNSWRDGVSFRFAFVGDNRNATETTVRAAILAGNNISSLDGTPSQGGNDTRMNGGLHNFKRYLEDWGGVPLNYCGSLINLYNSRVHTGTYKNGSKRVYDAPRRNWIFDTSFLIPTRIPPGTPFFQYVQVTGFTQDNSRRQSEPLPTPTPTL